MSKAQRIHAQAEKAMKEAVKKLVAQHRKLGTFMSVWQNGKVVRVPVKRSAK